MWLDCLLEKASCVLVLISRAWVGVRGVVVSFAIVRVKEMILIYLWGHSCLGCGCCVSGVLVFVMDDMLVVGVFNTKSFMWFGVEITNLGSRQRGCGQLSYS